jgi:hypothetical protein
MKTILGKVLEKKGINDISKLSPEEKATFDSWDKILSEGEISVEKIAEFCRKQISIIENRWSSEVINTPLATNEKLVIMHTVYKAILNLIVSPRQEKEAGKIFKYFIDRRKIVI